ncbi:ATP-dependent Clp protease adapter ClpS [Clavibacter michiganensis]|uniref:ATP-dependent Clp protease adapter protein ClpS n=2 Tax=Clavibacter michiganensis subsp. insidiosus TaxID=33014 RepID=A0A0D5CH58_9MICO|nr:ATP-dependent Clp protease adapter ClpS [Clavibacter michiganensis]AJW78620.1 Clp protease ClpS [Clavibacter michiganensis subsp. insidiosus]AWF98727.1 ATP-dependent Clp protease adapter ClpS [Clavibacter michiganensis subsp. insidiosus]AWG01055.1 ATP-dependent Clp protease adapter ClpS [Clavibacter michiganensis subsp. insidiosus]OQJ60377.1 ATP-dependent Clp protease adapter ClpS [Clavibacter michiganensis subsp. insidiosus]RII87404.1 ATP-dependent Clp protease adapter ClpS [Clavibacter mi
MTTTTADARAPRLLPAARRAADPPAGDPGSGTSTGSDTSLLERAATPPVWSCVVWNDPVNLMTYVSYVFRSYFGFTRERADELMLRVHEDGRAVVATGIREEIERHVLAMHGYGLWATLERVDA